MSHILLPVLRRLQEIFAAEGHPDGDAAAAALAGLGPLPPFSVAPPPVGLAPLQALLADGPDAGLADVLPLLHWRCSGLADGRIRPEIAARMLTCEVIGPTGMIPHKTAKVGLFYQAAEVDYVMRSHAAAETFVILGGQAEWRLGDAPARLLGPGDVTHHPSMAPHASVTRHVGTIAAWRWSGDLRFETYRMLG